MAALQAAFPLPDMSLIDDAIANGTHRPKSGESNLRRYPQLAAYVLSRCPPGHMR